MEFWVWNLISMFLAGLFLANAIPHLVKGVSGEKFPTPFAKPRGVGNSSALVNALWGSLNLLIGFIFLCVLGNFQAHSLLHITLFGAGWTIMSVFFGSALQQRPFLIVFATSEFRFAEF